MCIDNFGRESSGGSVFISPINDRVQRNYTAIPRGCDEDLVLECFEACAMASRLQDVDGALEAADAIAVRESWQKLLYSIATAKAKNVSGLMAKRLVLRACMDIEGPGPDWLNLLVTGFCDDMDIVLRKAEWSYRGKRGNSPRHGRRGWTFFGLEFLIEWAPVGRR